MKHLKQCLACGMTCRTVISVGSPQSFSKLLGSVSQMNPLTMRYLRLSANQLCWWRTEWFSYPINPRGGSTLLDLGIPALTKGALSSYNVDNKSISRYHYLHFTSKGSESSRATELTGWSCGLSPVWTTHLTLFLLRQSCIPGCQLRGWVSTLTFKNNYAFKCSFCT